ncbi:MAG TPA: hypothetical protein VKV23_08185 [Acidimicrobiales bacterium]|nr:hypothetical protein [Acidimicrobiales bacterium]
MPDPSWPEYLAELDRFLVALAPLLGTDEALALAAPAPPAGPVPGEVAAEAGRLAGEVERLVAVVLERRTENLRARRALGSSRREARRPPAFERTL